jgi:hypothetical protein
MTRNLPIRLARHGLAAILAAVLGLADASPAAAQAAGAPAAEAEQPAQAQRRPRPPRRTGDPMPAEARSLLEGAATALKEHEIYTAKENMRQAEALMRAALEEGETRLRSPVRNLARARVALDRNDRAAVETALERLTRPHGQRQAAAQRGAEN